MESTEFWLHLRSAFIQELFARIAKDYDRLNSIISLGLHHRWRKRAIMEIRGNYILDLCTETGDLSILAAKKGANVVAVDFCKEMLTIAKEKVGLVNLKDKIEFKLGHIPPLPFDDESFDCLICGFGLRHLPIKKKTFGELLRVLRLNGRMIILEVSRPKKRIFKEIHHLYFYHLMPCLGGIFAGWSKPYHYLEESTDLYLPSQERSF